MSHILTWKCLFKDELVGKKQGEISGKWLGPDMKAQETYGEVDWALAGEPDAWTGDGMDVNLDLDSHGLRHLDQQLSLINSKPNNSFQVIVTRDMIVLKPR